MKFILTSVTIFRMFKFLFPGTFDPPTLGHLMLIKRGSGLCDHLVVGIEKNLSKTKSILTVEERIEALKHETSSLKNVEIVKLFWACRKFRKSDRCKRSS